MGTTQVRHPWAAVGALLIGFFMTMIDSTIVTVASPAILRQLDADIIAVQWVTSAYLLALAVPMLVAGRLGDRFGQKNVVIVGVIVFTLASVWCGLASGIDMLIFARAVQGFGAALMSPQAMAIITRIFPPERRGAPLGLWGAAAGVAMLAGPILGGLLVGWFGWRAIFFINVPIGVAGLIATVAFVPQLERHRMRPDLVGVGLSGAAIFSLVFALQEGARYNWGRIAGPVYAWQFLVAGISFLALFLWWQRRRQADALVPLEMFRERNFALGTSAIAIVGFTMTAIPIPLQYYFQIGLGLKPSEAALLLVPMAVCSGILAPIVGRMTGYTDPRRFALVGLIVVAAAVLMYIMLTSPTRTVWWMTLPSALAGVGSALIWGPVSLIATRDLPGHRAGTGSSIFNVMRQFGSVLGSAAITAMMEAELTEDLPGDSGADVSALGAHGLPGTLAHPFAVAMSHAEFLPVASAVIGIALVARFTRRRATLPPPSPPSRSWSGRDQLVRMPRAARLPGAMVRRLLELRGVGSLGEG